MTHKIRFQLVGGFLGAGKTTSIARLAAMYQQRGRRVAIVTNDQAADLVDTHNLAAGGFAVEEVPGACFCCDFDTLMDKVRALADRERPDLILAEPVGSCTDLVATVVQPLMHLYAEGLEVAPFVVLFKASQGRAILRNEYTPGEGLSPKAGYIFRKQLEEADGIVLNRVDELSQRELEEVTSLVRTRYPDTPILTASALTGRGFDGLFEFMEQRGQFGRRILDLDYDTYAEGEAELGWLHTAFRLSAADPFDLDQALLEIIGGIQGGLTERGAEAAHVKTIGLAGPACAVANLVSSDGRPELSRASRTRTHETDVIINARVATDPSFLDAAVRSAIDSVARGRRATVEQGRTNCFRPARPQPTHRYSSTSS
jgi:Ni2+-binding GTPase involved in maturation of urease and hydrogenase